MTAFLAESFLVNIMQKLSKLVKICQSYQHKLLNLLPSFCRPWYSIDFHKQVACCDLVWCSWICVCVYMVDLRRFRTYKKHSVRDLLRAIRNKARTTLSCVIVTSLTILSCLLFELEYF